jgi:aminopeptidase
MLTKRQMERYSDVLVWALRAARTKRFKKNDVVLIRYEMAAVRMAEVLQAKILDLGMNPILRLGWTPKMEHNFFEKANHSQLVYQTPGEMELCKRLDGGIYLQAPESLTHLSHIDPKRIGKAAIARKPLRDILDRREAEGRFGWTLCLLPTVELARQARLPVGQYTAQIVRACYLDRGDPVREWREIYKDIMAIKNWMNRMEVKFYHIESENIDLRITPGKRRKWIGVSGHNIPSFEVFISPDWRGTEGIYFANQPSFRTGNYVRDVQLEFKKGKAVVIGAKRGGAFVAKQLSMDPGANRVGEFSLTDRRFSRINKFMANTLFDENFGGRYGNCHIAVGASYSDSYDGDPAELTKEKKKRLGYNDSALHWDLVNTEKKTVTAHLISGKKVVIYENGMFRY